MRFNETNLLSAPLTNFLINHFFLILLLALLLVLQEVGSIIGKKGDNIKKIRIEVSSQLKLKN